MERLTAMLLVFLPFFSLAQITEEKDFRHYFEGYGVNGSFMLYDLTTKNYTIYHKERNNIGFIPASTFKIPNSLIALELGIIENEKTVIKWDGVTRSVAAWNRDMTFTEAIRVSCVPCYQEIARKVGVKNYHYFLKKLHFGGMDVNADNLDMFWLTGQSNITVVEQIGFLVRLYNDQLDVSQRSMAIVKDMLFLEKQGETVLRGKTGWANAVSNGPENNIGWFVGWVEKDGKPYFFATNVGAMNPDEDQFIKSRIGITKAILRELHLWE